MSLLVRAICTQQTDKVDFLIIWASSCEYAMFTRISVNEARKLAEPPQGVFAAVNKAQLTSVITADTGRCSPKRR